MTASSDTISIDRIFSLIIISFKSSPGKEDIDMITNK